MNTRPGAAGRLAGLVLLGAVLQAPAENPPDLASLPSGDEILSSVRKNLPSQPVSIEAELRVRSPDGKTERFLLIRMRLDWGAAEPKARYELLDRFGDPLAVMTVTRPRGEAPRFNLAGEEGEPDLFTPVAGTELTWMDLSFGYLWWEGAERVGFEEKKGRVCHVVDLPAPPDTPSTGKIRLWIDRDVFAVLEAEAYDPRGELTRRVRVKSFQKMDELWTLKDLDGIAYPSRRKTTLRVQKMTFEPPENQPDP